MIIVVVLVAAVTLIYYYLTLNNDYWKKKGVPYIPPLPFFGNLKPLILLQKCPASFMSSLHNAPQAVGQRFVGIFLCNNEPAILLRDPALIQQMIGKDSAYFYNRNIYTDPNDDPLGHNSLFASKDENWKYLRSMLAPTFSSAKLKLMFNLILEITDELKVAIDDRLAKKEQLIEMKEICCQYTTDVISSCAFGIQSNSLNDPNALFRGFGRLLVEGLGFKRCLELRSIFFMHWFVRLFKVTMFNKTSTEFFQGVFWNALTEREKSGRTRNDFMDTLVRLKQDSARKLAENPETPELLRCEGDVLVAQSVMFFVAGFEPTASTISNALTELAFAPEMQEKLRQEIFKNLASHDGQLTYEGIFEMKYLDKVICEVLRKYPAMTFLDRVCAKNYKIPDSDVVIEKGTPLFVSLFRGVHYDPENFPDPERFDPERFSEENKNSRHSFAWTPFGEGPHLCIGKRFAMMAVKTALSLLIMKYRVEPSESVKLPFELDERSLLLTTVGALHLKITALS